ncbi:AAA family ATPase [Pseudomonas mosselii]|uniref:AAA family ATPase n=1 Tax=Pseudomonas mosselii TaxID=78327 RepID=UPI00260B7223|nr:AAA family ATPase [Pseudomonas mosselii]MDN4500109.1 AAA family ATPase [Pseudomonas mosselii]
MEIAMQAQHQDDLQNFVDFSAIQLSPRFAAESFGLSTRRLAVIEAEHGIEIQRKLGGAVPTRVYTPQDLFEIAAVRRAAGLSKGFGRQMVASTFVPKGGTAKTTLAVNISIVAQITGLKVLLIDNDPQGDSSSMLGYDPDFDADDLQEMGIPRDRLVDGHFGNLMQSLLRMRVFDHKGLDGVIKKPFGENGVHLIPADAYLDDLSVALDAMDNSDMWYSQWLQKANNGGIPGCDVSGYDLIIFDNAPATSRLTKNAVAASDMLLCPVRMDKFSFRALNRLNDWCVRFAQAYKYAPAVTAVPTMFIRNRPRLLASLATLNQLFPGRVTEEKLFFSEDYSKSLDEGVPLMFWKQANKDTLAGARRVYHEVLNRIRDLSHSA